jgi:hypothetical protein
MPVLEAVPSFPERLSLLVACLQGTCGSIDSLQGEQQAPEHNSGSQNKEKRDPEQEKDVFPMES